MGGLYLGIDGGQSSTTALIADESGCVIGYGRGGPCNHVGNAEGRTRFLKAIREVLRQACEPAGLNADTVTFRAACLGFSGGAEDKESYSRELIRSSRYRITHDAEVALAGATEGKPGVIVIAGTGSMAFGCNAEGKMARAGGWGYIFGDEGGAFDLARQALRASLQFEEGWGPHTELRRHLLKITGARDANDLLHRFYASLRRSEIASLATIVDQAANEGDEVSHAILKTAARQLARFVEAVYRQLFPAKDPVVVAHIGNVFQSDVLRMEFVEQLRIRIGCQATPPHLGPAAGALLLALRSDGNPAALSGVPESEK